MAFQYFHRSDNSLTERFTVCVDVPDKSIFEDLVKPYLEKNINLPCGYTEVHPDDQYNKKIGRQYSKERVRSRSFCLTKVEYYDNETMLKFSAHLEGIYDLWFIIRPNYKRAHLVFASLLKN